MANYMSTSSNFTPIDVSEAQNAANNGDVVIASYIASSGSGHVALVVPGEASMQGTWEGQSAKSMGGIPKVMDTGAGMRTEEQPVNYSFGKPKQDEVVFYKYTPALSNGNSQTVQETITLVNPQETITLVNPYTGVKTELPKPRQQFFSAAPDPTLGKQLQQSRVDIVKTVGHILNYFGF